MQHPLSFFSRAGLAALLAVLFFCASAPAYAASNIKLAWDANTEPDVSGYRVYYRTEPGAYTGFVNAGNKTTVTLASLPAGTYFAAVTALGSGGIESAFSDEVTFTITPAAPGARLLGGLVEPEGVDGLRGVFTLTVNPAGVVSGRLIVGSAAYTVKSKFDANGDLSVLVRRKEPLRSLMLVLHLNPDGSVTGAIEDGFGSTLSNISMEPTTFVAKTNEAPQKGRYTVVLSPDSSPNAISKGLGVATLNVSKLGVARLVGTLSDGSRITYSAKVGNQGSLPIYILLYGKLGSLYGDATFRAVSNVSDADGVVSLYKPGTAQPVANLGMKAARYQFTRNVPAMPGLVESAGIAHVSFLEGDLASPIVDRPLAVSATHVVTSMPPNTERITFAMVPSSGVFSGRFTSGNVTRTFRGVVYQKGSGSGTGWFASPDHSGRVEFEPGQ
jgi:hypothetical protein